MVNFHPSIMARYRGCGDGGGLTLRRDKACLVSTNPRKPEQTLWWDGDVQWSISIHPSWRGIGDVATVVV